MGSQLNGRNVLGIASGPTLVFAGTGNDYQAIDGMNVTLEMDQDHMAIDFYCEASASIAPGTMSFAVEVDGNVDLRNVVTFTPGVTAITEYAGSFFIMAGPGRHQFRLMMVCTTAATITFVGRNRAMRMMFMNETV